MVACFSNCRTSKKAAQKSLQLDTMQQSSMLSSANQFMNMMFQMMTAYHQQQQAEPSSSSRPSTGKRSLAISYPQPGKQLALGDHIVDPPHDEPTGEKPLHEPQSEKPLDAPQSNKSLIEIPQPQEPNKKGVPMSVEEQAALVSGKPAGQTAKKRPAAAVAQKKPACQAGIAGGAAKGKGPLKIKPSKITDASHGWKVEERIRQNGGVDRYYISPLGKSYRIRQEAFAAGFTG